MQGLLLHLQPLRAPGLREAAGQREGEKQDLSQEHKNEREKLYGDKEQLIRTERDAIKQSYRPEWDRLRQTQKEEWINLRKLQRSASHKVEHFLKDRPSEYIRMEKKDRGRFLSEMFDVHTRYAVELAKRHKDQRTELSREIKGRIGKRIDQINQGYKADLAAMRDRQWREVDALKLRQKLESEEQAREIKDGRDRERSVIRRTRDALNDGFARPDVASPSDHG